MVYSQSNSSLSGTNFFIQDLGTADFYGLEFIDTAEDRVLVNQNLSSKPSVLIQGTQIVLDYSDIGNIKDRQFIDLAFKAMSAGAGFTITGAVYNDPTNSYEANLAASCTLNSYTNLKIRGTVSAIGTTSEINYYKPEFFETVPQIQTASGLTYDGITSNSLINFTTSTDTSFVSNNFQINDYVDFDTASNSARFTIFGITLDTFGREIISFDPTIRVVAENLKGTQVTVGHKRKVDNNENPYQISQQPTVVHRVDTRLVDGIEMLTIDNELTKPLVLSRGLVYLFVVNTASSINFGFNSIPGDSNTTYTDAGLYSVVDNTMDKTYIFFIPNNNTPNQLYYSSRSRPSAGIGGVQITGNYSYSYDTRLIPTAGFTSSTSTYSGFATNY
tara:strand:- start:440 stop:1603 length:1164 start_codon:yes stop_codon:yes gene_type:complete